MSGHHTLVGSSRPRVVRPMARLKVTAKMWALAWPRAERVSEVCLCGAHIAWGGIIFDRGTDTQHECPVAV